MTGVIVGIQKDSNDNKVYRIVLYDRTGEGCQYNKQMCSEEQLVKLMVSGKLYLDNAAVIDGKIKGTTGSLDRFNATKFHPMVILSEIVAEDQVIGYRLVSFDGRVSTVRIKDALAYCARTMRVGNKVPIQNAMFIQESENSKSYIRAYPGQVFHQEKVNRKRSPDAKPAKINQDENNKQVSRIEELFNKEQIKELKLGKQNGVDIRIYGNNKLSAKQMKEIRKALEDGINARTFADPAYSAEAMRSLRINAKYGVDITYFMNPKYNAGQIYELSTGYLSGVDISKYANPEMSAKDMAKERVYLESQLWNEVDATELKQLK